MKDIVTIIIPCRNAEATIQRAVESAVKAGADYVMCYDDASTDDTKGILEALSAQYPQVEFYSQLHDVRAGVHFGRNFLIEIADAGLIFPLDADDTICDLQALVRAWQPNTWVYGDHLEHEGEQVTRVKGVAPGALARREITGVSFLFHSDDWKRAGGYDPDFAFAEDYALQCALVNAGVRPVQIDCIAYERYLKPAGNERTMLAGEYWQFYHTMARRKYQNVFKGTG